MPYLSLLIIRPPWREDRKGHEMLDELSVIFRNSAVV